MGIPIQIIKKPNEADRIAVAFKYYSIISIISDLQLTNKQIQMLAFTCVRGTITPPSARTEFIEMFHTTRDSMENIKSQLIKKKLIIKMEEMYRVDPLIAPDFSSGIFLKIFLNHKQTDEKGKEEPTV